MFLLRNNHHRHRVDQNRKAEAINVLNKADQNILNENHPYAMVSKNNQHNYFTFKFLEASYKAGDKELAV